MHLIVMPEMKKIDTTAPYLTVILGNRGPSSDPTQGHTLAKKMLNAVPIKNQCFKAPLRSAKGQGSIDSWGNFMAIDKPIWMILR